MAALEYLQLLRRRWYVLVVCLALTALGVTAIPRDAGVYWGRVSVAFLPPSNTKRLGNALEGSDPSLIYFAAAVERSLSGGRPGPRVSSTGATLYGLGVTKGSSIALVDSGGQWRTNFNRPVIQIEVVDPSQAEAESEMARLVAAVDEQAAAMQRGLGAPDNAIIRTELYPQQPVLNRVGGNWKRAVAGASLLGIGLSLSVTYFFDLRLSRRRKLDVDD